MCIFVPSLIVSGVPIVIIKRRKTKKKKAMAVKYSSTMSLFNSLNYIKRFKKGPRSCISGLIGPQFQWVWCSENQQSQIKACGPLNPQPSWYSMHKVSIAGGAP